jgi:DNA polymerase IV
MDCRKIIHIDMDAFYASVEQRDHAAYRGKPLAVGGGSERGVVAAASYEARKFGIHSAMPGVTARKKCPDLIFVKPRFDVYKAISRQIRDIFEEYTDLVEPLSLDEAYLDVTHPLKGKPSATLIAIEIRERIFKETRLTCSAGISYNKFLAKIASDVNKPNGFFVIRPEDAARYIDQLPIEKFHGIGRITAGKLQKMGINTGKDLCETDLEVLVRHFGKNGTYFYHIARGEDNRPVQPHRIRKSLGAENTFLTDMLTPEELDPELEKICREVHRRLQRANRIGKTITVKIKYHDFIQVTRSRSFTQPVISYEQIFEIARELLHQHREPQKPIRLLGVTFSQLENTSHLPGRQLCLDL